MRVWRPLVWLRAVGVGVGVGAWLGWRERVGGLRCFGCSESCDNGREQQQGRDRLPPPSPSSPPPRLAAWRSQAPHLTPDSLMRRKRPRSLSPAEKWKTLLSTASSLLPGWRLCARGRFGCGFGWERGGVGCGIVQWGGGGGGGTEPPDA